MIRIKNIKVDVITNNVLDEIAKKLKINKKYIKSYKILKQSIDARDKNNIFYVYDLVCDVVNVKVHFNKDVLKYKEEKYNYLFDGKEKINYRPIVVGFGPAGIFASYLLALNGFKPIIIERGSCVSKRIDDVNKFFETGILDVNSNVQFGEGGAGTFSDGKLNTGIKDKFNRISFILETFVKFGAPEEILYSYKPHIGTDNLVEVVKNMREEIKKLGGKFLFDTTVTNLKIEDNQIIGVEINNKELIKSNHVILAIGHSARDTFYMLKDNNVLMENKPFAVGLRIMHSQDKIDESQYGDKYKNILKKSSYKLVYQSSNKHGVYSFCMCPGGYVINASSEQGMLAVNGMSNYDRESKNANAALIVTVNENIYGTNLFDGIKFQRKLEKCAFELGSGSIPVQLLKDFIDNKESTDFKSIKPIIKGTYKFANLRKLMPDELNDALIESFDFFDKKIRNYKDPDAILAGIESRTSSPIKIIRDDEFVSNIKGLYPTGEGAGYAGGITSSAVDGIKVAEKIASIYKI